MPRGRTSLRHRVADAHRLVRVDDRDITLWVGFPDGVERVSGAELSVWLGHSRERDFRNNVVYRLGRERTDLVEIVDRAELRAQLVHGGGTRSYTWRHPGSPSTRRSSPPSRATPTALGA